jgi:hypothetical protein
VGTPRIQAIFHISLPTCHKFYCFVRGRNISLILKNKISQYSDPQAEKQVFFSQQLIPDPKEYDIKESPSENTTPHILKTFQTEIGIYSFKEKIKGKVNLLS